MTPATAELQRASLAIALDATYRAMEQQPVNLAAAAARTLGLPLGMPVLRQSAEILKEQEQADREANFATGFQTETHEDDEPFSCLTCEDTGEIEIQQRNAAGQPLREPWATQTIACPDCNPTGAR